MTGENNYANGNMGENRILLFGGFGEYLGGKDNDTFEAFASEHGTLINGENCIAGNVGGVIYWGGKDNGFLAVS